MARKVNTDDFDPKKRYPAKDRQGNTITGVFYRYARRADLKGLEKSYVVVFKTRDDSGKVKTVEESVGKEFKDKMTPAKANRMRMALIEGRQKTKREKAEAEAGEWTVQDLWEFFEKKKGDKLKSFRDDRYRYREHIGKHLAKTRVSELEKKHISGIRGRMEGTHKPQTIRHVLLLLQRMVRYGVKEGGLTYPPSLSFDMPTVKNEVTEDLTEKQLDHLIEVLNNHPNKQIANLMKMAIATGMRRSELFRLKWEHINYERNFIKIVTPKGGTEVTIPLGAVARYILENHEKLDSPYVFPGKNGGQRKDCKTAVRSLVEKLDLPKGFRPLHGLRHTYASMLASSGEVEMHVLQKLLTHKSPAMTQRYAHLREAAQHRASDVASSILSKMGNGNGQDGDSR
ncbi:tyrosine-type recombinase/integrase [Desulfopila aestuarii]|uniref:Site-specific recombinase XerD n=1 Tax=Desulfopila aestuarii DSM 18488 TaxID=1121416 RepID=A0A1M7YH53_9BACT|nr:site-specific integrase [Desulfopila aestuarii]SHO51916.1 Site-specific recombinase XerD [Desulfopila aestuarii DSM 18488]